MKSSDVKPTNGKQSLGRYMCKNLGIGVPLISSVGIVIAFAMGLERADVFRLFLCFLVSGGVVGALVSLKNYKRFLKPIYEMERGIIQVSSGDLTQSYSTFG